MKHNSNCKKKAKTEGKRNGKEIIIIMRSGAGRRGIADVSHWRCLQWKNWLCLLSKTIRMNIVWVMPRIVHTIRIWNCFGKVFFLFLCYWHWIAVRHMVNFFFLPENSTCLFTLLSILLWRGNENNMLLFYCVHACLTIE